MTSLHPTFPKYDLLSEEALYNPYPLYKVMRECDPVYFYEPGNFWFLTKYQDVETGFLHKGLSADKRDLYAARLKSLDASIIKNYLELFDRMISEKDPPEYTKFRKVANPAFTASALQRWSCVMRETANELLDRVIDKGEMDLVSDFSAQLPSLIICEMFDIPHKYREDFMQWGKDINKFWGVPNPEEMEESAIKADFASASFTSLINELIRERKDDPGSDLISLLTDGYEKEGIDLEELPSLCVLILIAGHVTVLDAIPNSLNALFQHPNQFQLLQENQNLIESAVEEMLRYDCPTVVMLRVAKEEVEFSNTKIPAGSTLALAIGAANRDPAKFKSPEEFDITRSPNEHISFAKGAHSCLGSVLARMELKITFETLMHRVPNLAPHPSKMPVPKRKTLLFKGFESFPVVF